MIIRDRIADAPEEYRRRPRTRAEVRALVLHQTGFEWRYTNPMWTRVRAHFVVHQGGQVTQLHSILTRMRYGCGIGNAYAINVEGEGNYPLEYRDGEPVYWRPEKFGRSVLAEHPEQIEAARELAAYLAKQIPGLMIGAHRQIELDRSGCCGPDVWRELGQNAVDGGMPELPVAGGRPIPDSWRSTNYSEIPISSVRAYTGPLAVR